jgi:hypothetical protein
MIPERNEQICHQPREHVSATVALRLENSDRSSVKHLLRSEAIATLNPLTGQEW